MFDPSKALAVVPLAHPAGEESTWVLVTCSRRQICEDLSADGFARGHGLSSTEGKVLTALCGGRQAAEIAADHGVALSTVRTQITNIRRKTDTASIEELRQRISRLPPMLGALRSQRVECASTGR